MAIMDKRRALGRGLESLLPAKQETVSIDASVEMVGKPLELPLHLIERNPFQTRTTFDPEKLSELAASIRAMGVVQAITVRRIGGNRFQLISGERRLIASKEAGKTTIPAMVRDVSDEQAMEMTIVENLQRADLNPIEQAKAYHRLSTDFKMTQEQMAIRVGKERATVANFLRLLKLPDFVQSKLETAELSFGHAKILLGLATQEQMAAVAQKVLALNLSVRQTETYVQGIMNPEARVAKAEPVKEPQDPNVHEAQDRMQRALGLRVKIEDKHGKGRVIIEYAGLEDFDLIMGALKAGE